MDGYSGDGKQLKLVEGTEEVIIANRAYQDHLRGLMKRVHDARERTNQLQARKTGGSS